MKTYITRLLGLTMLLAFLSLSAAGRAQDVASTAVLRNTWLEKHNRQVAVALQDGCEIMFLGDSITEGWAGRGMEVWNHEFAPRRAVNFGISGDRTEHVIWRLQNGALSAEIQPRLVVLMIGTNNMGRDSAEQIAAGVGVIVREIQARAPSAKILLLGIFPRSAGADEPIRAKIAATNAIIAKISGVTFLDIGGQFLEADGSLSREIMPDLLHLSATAYARWAMAIKPVMAELLK